MAISEQLREAIRKSGLSVNQLSKESGVPRPVISRFMSDDPAIHRDIRLEATADRLAAYFGLTLTPAKPKTAAPKKRKSSR